ncbi:hypothetical protein HNQ96_004518 [Aminobacter lissarensis]|uniref:Uncharacterized protein n=1 Tax=Aminobacter carboxidus TaxID=376165 RepID=A0A8E1WJ85_9HYPH|nr:hypothetical protein [Aminobacter lissarensis]MBB6468634.1 hypothetical protein [Aminobacter lissarensis]
MSFAGRLRRAARRLCHSHRERVGCADFCIAKDVIGVNLTEGEIGRRAETGMSFKVLGRRALLTMTAPPGYFSAIIDAHRKARDAG